MSVFINGWTKESVKQHIKDNFTGKAVIENSDFCKYLTNDGRKCAIGMFIPDGHKGQYFLGGVEYLIQDNPDLDKCMPMQIIYLIGLQRVHDQGSQSSSYVDKRNNNQILQEMLNYIDTL